MPRNWLHVTGFGNRNPDVTLYNSPGTNQYKYGWWGTLPVVSGTLRTVRVYIHSPSGNPTLEWAIYPSVPADGCPVVRRQRLVQSQGYRQQTGMN